MKLVITTAVLLCSLALSAQVKVGQPAPEISLPNAKGDTLTLSSFKGKVVLIDFWASWCRPCRESNPHVVKLYEKYKDKGFEVFGVSIDNNKSSWLKAVKRDKIPYTQVIDGEGWDAPTAMRYGVDAIPATFVLNKDGKIEAINLEGPELEEKIKELLH